MADGPITTIMIDSSSVDVATAGSYTVTYDCADAAGNDAPQLTRTVNVVDTDAPVIRVNGDSTNRIVTILVGDTYTVPAGDVTDNDRAYTGSVTATPSTINTNIPANHTITYDAPADASGNVPIPVVLTVNIVAPDTTSPEITLLGSNPQEITVGTSYTELGATCTDGTDGVITPIINSDNVVVTVAGSYTVTYDCADTSGNDAPQVTRTVTVTIRDTTPPLITVDGSSENRTITTLVGESYTELVGSVDDTDDASYSGTVTATTAPSVVDTTMPGTFIITYTSTDANAEGLVPVPVVLTVDISCPDGQSFSLACYTPATITVTGLDNRYSINDTLTDVMTSLSESSTTATFAITSQSQNFNGSTHPTSTITTSASIGTLSDFTFTCNSAGLNKWEFTSSYQTSVTLPDGTTATTTALAVPTIVRFYVTATPDDNCIGLTFGSGGSSSEWKTKPTFGLSWENNQPFVSSGFTLNDHTLDITNNWHTNFVPVSGVIGKENNAKIKVYAPNGLNTVMLSLGVPEVGKVNDAETNIIVSILPNYTGTISYTITEITHEQKESLVDETQTTATLSKSLCNDSDIIEKCYTVDINFVVLAPLKSEPIAITAIDTKHRYTTTYINEGLTFVGNSMLEPATAQLVVKKGNQYDAETIDLIQQDRRHNLWEDQYGNLWTQNDHDTWIQLTFPENTPTDSYVNVMTRMHSAFDSRVDVHTQNMESIRDSMYRDVYTDADDDQ